MIYDFFTKPPALSTRWVLPFRAFVLELTQGNLLAGQHMGDAGQSGVLSLCLSGRFRVASAARGDVTPRGAKAQALLALLATSPDLCRNRRWLEDKLWSDRGTDQAAASLRQSLSELRRCFGPEHDILITDRQKVGLVRDRVLVEIQTSGDQEFLEGLDVRDPEFEHWLRDQRHRQLSQEPLPGVLRRAHPAPGPEKSATPLAPRGDRRNFIIVLQKTRGVADSLGLLEDLFIDAVALSLREALGVTVFTRAQSPEFPNTIAVSVQAMATGNGDHFLRVRAVEQGNGHLIWSGRSENLATVRGPEDMGLILFANQTVEVLGDTLSLHIDGYGDLDSLVLQRLAARKLWTMNAARLAEADMLLVLSDEMKQRGLNAARRAQVRVLQLIEGHAEDPQAIREEALAYSRMALEREPNNSMVLAIVAYVRCALDDSPVYGADLARRSVRMNPNNPLAWDSMSYAKLHAGQIAEAHEIALKVQKIGMAAPNKFWWDMGLCLTAALAGDQGLALQMAEASALEAPDFRAAQRYVVALAAGMDRPGQALAAAGKLETLEPTFSIEALALDPAYPVGILRRAGLLQSDRIMALTG
jgi:hypothetical protein